MRSIEILLGGGIVGYHISLVNYTTLIQLWFFPNLTSARRHLFVISRAVCLQSPFLPAGHLPPTQKGDLFRIRFFT